MPYAQGRTKSVLPPCFTAPSRKLPQGVPTYSCALTGAPVMGSLSPMRLRGHVRLAYPYPFPPTGALCTASAGLLFPSLPYHQFPLSYIRFFCLSTLFSCIFAQPPQSGAASKNWNLSVSWMEPWCMPPGVVSTERSDLGSPFGRAGCPVRGSLRGSHVAITRFQTANGVPSQSACSADSSPIGRAKGAAAPVR